MKKPKKITIKFFLNTFLNPIDENEECYPLYVQITFNRKNTQIKCQYGGYFKSLEWIKENDPYLLPFEEKNFRKMMLYEVDKQGDLLDMVGLGDKYDKFCLSTHALFNNYLKARLRSESMRAKPKEFSDVIDYRKKNLAFSTILKASIKLFDNLEEVLTPEFREEMRMYEVYYKLYEIPLNDKKYLFPTVIDWLNGSHIEELSEKLKEVFNQEPEMVTKTIVLINGIILSRIEKVR